MARVKGGVVSRKRRKSVLKQAKGYFGSKHALFRTAKEQVMNSLAYAYNDRRKRKTVFRKLWITRINAQARKYDLSYSQFMNGLNKAKIDINRKMLSELAINSPDIFEKFVSIAKAALTGTNVDISTISEHTTDFTIEEISETLETSQDVDVIQEVVSQKNGNETNS